MSFKKIFFDTHSCFWKLWVVLEAGSLTLPYITLQVSVTMISSCRVKAATATRMSDN